MLGMYLTAMRQTGLANAATVHVCVNLEHNTAQNRRLMHDIVKAHLPHAVLELYAGNEHEYRGIHKVWQIATAQHSEGRQMSMHYERQAEA